MNVPSPSLGLAYEQRPLAAWFMKVYKSTPMI